MSTPCLSLHRVAYCARDRAFHAEAQILDLTGIQRRPVQWRGPLCADFTQIARGLRDAVLSAR